MSSRLIFDPFHLGRTIKVYIFLFRTDGLHDSVNQYILSSEILRPKVRFTKTDRREGLIRARLFGANLAVGDVIPYAGYILNSFCETWVNGV